MATMLAHGGETIADIETLRHQEAHAHAVAGRRLSWGRHSTTRHVVMGREWRVARTRGRVCRIWPVWPAGEDVGLDSDVVVLDDGCRGRDRPLRREEGGGHAKRTDGVHPLRVGATVGATGSSSRFRSGHASANTATDPLGRFCRCCRSRSRGRSASSSSAALTGPCLARAAGLADRRRGETWLPVQYSVGCDSTEHTSAPLKSSFAPPIRTSPRDVSLWAMRCRLPVHHIER